MKTERTQSSNNTPTNTESIKHLLGARKYKNLSKSIRKDGTDKQYETIIEKRQWEWMKEQKSDFKSLKRESTTQPCLVHFNGIKENIVTTDACKTGLRIALWRRQGNGKVKSITFASCDLCNAEKRPCWKIIIISSGLGLRKILLLVVRETNYSPTTKQ